MVDLLSQFALVLTVLFAIQYFVVPREILTSTGDRAHKQNQINEAMKPYRRQSLTAVGVIILAYHVLLRTSRAGTLGYRIAGIRLISEFGQPPDLRLAGRRFLLAVPFCGCFALTYLTCRTNNHKQAAHDQWVGTWMVRSNAEPAGPAVVEYHQKLLGTFILRYKALAPAPIEVSPEAGVMASTAGSR
ncbi:MAG: RDD family protein [Planctomycetes bacterium]|nr:RDD family protein [Planctomycetota bacterium]